MWSTIGLATARQLRLVGSRGAGRLVGQYIRRTARPGVVFRSTTVSGSIILRRSFTETQSRPSKTDASTKKPAIRKPAAKKAPPTKKKAAAAKKRVKKVLTEEQKEKLKGKVKEKKQKLRIVELKRVALMDEQPKSLPVSPWTLYISKAFKDAKVSHPNNLVKAMAEIRSTFLDLSPERRGALEAEVSRNRVANTAAHRAWVETRSPLDIAAANRARRSLKKLGFSGKLLQQIKDDRLPKSPLTAFLSFLNQRRKDGDYAGLTVQEISAKGSAEWKALSDAEREKHFELSKINRIRYNDEVEAIRESSPPTV